ncbi:MAG: OmpH family outer membrane protein [Prevotella sp.]|jgi:outer membrane protein|nr:OmpH family outer membrane protein [Prevotella sp.]
MFKKLFLLLLIVAPISAFAQNKIAYVNAQEIFFKMPEMKDVESQLATERETIQKRSAEIETEFNTLAEKFQKDTTGLSESLLLDRQNQLDALRQRYQSYVQTSGAEFEKKQQSLLQPLQEKMMRAIKEVGDENSYTCIIEAASLLYVGSSALDASKLVKTKLNITD